MSLKDACDDAHSVDQLSDHSSFTLRLFIQSQALDSPKQDSCHPAADMLHTKLLSVARCWSSSVSSHMLTVTRFACTNSLYAAVTKSLRSTQNLLLLYFFWSDFSKPIPLASAYLHVISRICHSVSLNCCQRSNRTQQAIYVALLMIVRSSTIGQSGK